MVVVSTAIKRDNPELIAARAKRLPVVRRAEMLAELMRLKSCVAIAGTHGKTTTTSLVAALVDAGGFDPTVINGGIINAYGTNARLGAGDWMVVEADESDGTFLKLPADVAIVTNVDPEHLDHFVTFEAVQEAFRAFVENVPFYGFAVMCTDHPVVQLLVGQITDRRIITYGENPQADVRLSISTMPMVNHASRSSFAIAPARSCTRSTISLLPMPGRHNALNATAAIAVAHELGVGDDLIRRRLRSSAAYGADSPAPANGMACRSSTTMAIIRSRLQPCCVRPRETNAGRVIAVDAAAPLHAACVFVRAVLDLLQRCRHGDRHPCLSGGRGANCRR